MNSDIESALNNAQERMMITIYKLFRIIDDIDTASDMFKDNYKSYQIYVMKMVKERWSHIDEKFVDELYEKFHPKDDDLQQRNFK